MIIVKKEISLGKRILGSLFFLSLSLISLLMFSFAMYRLMDSMINHKKVIVFSKSPMYLLGGVSIMFISFILVLFSNQDQIVNVDREIKFT
ncbi:hypothetical protein VQ7734_01146 [Vibrio quintilis]|uniref:Uncharacterized protein n=1 Tax=Vibrio quintilis TaxID=1117707 RepID=A0A1M7YS27_9VIBR|nr:hypothetical protein VQ7734_01146 [Vibrio quintilis]